MTKFGAWAFDGIGRPYVLIAVLLLTANYGWGSNSSCTASPSYTQASSYNGSQTGSTTAGCYEVDKTFSDFTAGPGFGDVTGIYVAGSQSGFTNGLAAYDVSALFSGSAGGGPWTATGGLRGESEKDFTFVVDSANTYGFDAAYPPLATSSLITDITMFASGDLGAGSFIDVDEEVCIGAGTCANGAAHSIELSGSISGTTFSSSCSILGTVAGATCSPDGATVTFSTAITAVTIYASFDIEGPSTGISSLDGFGDTFGEQGTDTPEPSTLVLLGSAFAGLAALRRRKLLAARLL